MSKETEEPQKPQIAQKARRAQEAADVSAAIDGELRLLDPAVRLSRSAAEALLDPEFVEVGASGKRWTYEEMVAALPGLDGGGANGPRFEPSGMTGVVLAPGLVHLTYETVVGGHRARRSSLWRRRDGETAWRMYYHQGTPVPGGEGAGHS
ncbi:nuclear transport factor 2 family protein [Streptomyces sp. SID14515]|uniref:nuclear transport factor 2 family protein n=1 Tax=Streptomyces sp. SID14515 TaxID=2706074 RepID=UPI0013C86E41|nr:nuclear transport factor 2 family protein [Streptomyces sp. SID14515]NEB38914.1 nuclear transport factor 2 family protein [Streptomyces sp. SID14515]